MVEEYWKDIPGFEGYQLSNLGRVRSCRLVGNGKVGPIWKPVKTFLRCVNIKANYHISCIVIRKLGQRKTYTFTLSRLLWELFKGPIPEGYIIEHKDGNPQNNCFDNIRLATQQQNSFNASIRKTKKDGLSKGVLKTKYNKYEAKITLNKKTFYLGSFNSEVEAAKAYNEAAQKYFGEFAKLNETKEVIN